MVKVKGGRDGGGRGGELVSLLIFSLPPCGVCRSPVPSVYSTNYKNGLPFLRKSQLMSFISVLYSDTIRPPHAPRGTTFPTSGCAKDFSYLDASQ